MTSLVPFVAFVWSLSISAAHVAPIDVKAISAMLPAITPVATVEQQPEVLPLEAAPCEEDFGVVDGMVDELLNADVLDEQEACCPDGCVVQPEPPPVEEEAEVSPPDAEEPAALPDPELGPAPDEAQPAFEAPVAAAADGLWHQASASLKAILADLPIAVDHAIAAARIEHMQRIIYVIPAVTP